MRTRIKICGLTREADVAAAIEAGADAVGFVCYPKSPRYVAPLRLRALSRELGVFSSPVLLFVNAASDWSRARSRWSLTRCCSFMAMSTNPRAAVINIHTFERFDGR